MIIRFERDSTHAQRGLSVQYAQYNSVNLLSNCFGLQAMKRFDWVRVELAWLDEGIAIQQKKNVE